MNPNLKRICLKYQMGIFFKTFIVAVKEAINFNARNRKKLAINSIRAIMRVELSCDVKKRSHGFFKKNSNVKSPTMVNSFFCLVSCTLKI